MTKGRGLKLGVIGVGSMGQHHARILSTLPGVKLFGVADQDQERVKQIAVRFGIQPFFDFKELLPQIDAAVIAVPTSLHFEIAVECLNTGKHLLIEKPLAHTLDQAQRLVDLAAQKNLILAAGFVERFNPAFQELQKLIRKEKIIGVHVHRLSPFPERIADTNVIQDMMIHDLDLVLTLLPKEEIESLKATGEKVKTKKFDKVTATIFYRSGLVTKLEADRVFGIKSRKITVTTERGLIESDLLNKRVYLRDLQHHVPSVHYTKTKDQLTAELFDFVSAIKKNSRPKVPGQEALAAQKLAEEVEQACS
ncbi:MAG: Gfo/Idh/MocA family oxidoreductase [Candidatus Saganbacteria bacterium]|nr:Gfo/Idh/MocA family oxidoreductase [Candidatus Saganbacteria bacterium]